MRRLLLLHHRGAELLSWTDLHWQNPENTRTSFKLQVELQTKDNDSLRGVDRCDQTNCWINELTSRQRHKVKKQPSDWCSLSIRMNLRIHFSLNVSANNTVEPTEFWWCWDCVSGWNQQQSHYKPGRVTSCSARPIRTRLAANGC